MILIYFLSNKIYLPKVYASVWHTPVARILIRTSPAFGGATSIVSMDNGSFAAQATAALHEII